MKTPTRYTSLNLEQLKEHFRDAYDVSPGELIEELGISVDEVLDRFEDKVLQYLEDNYTNEEAGEEEDD